MTTATDWIDAQRKALVEHEADGRGVVDPTSRAVYFPTGATADAMNGAHPRSPDNPDQLRLNVRQYWRLRLRIVGREFDDIAAKPYPTVADLDRLEVLLATLRRGHDAMAAAGRELNAAGRRFNLEDPDPDEPARREAALAKLRAGRG